MAILQNIGLLVVGLVVLILGGDYLVRGASSIALKLHISPLVVGLTVVAFGTSVPELLISLSAAVSGSPDLAMGNVVGSNICNLGLVLGITAFIGPIYVHADSIRIDWPVTIGSSLLLYLLVWDNELKWIEGAVFISLLIIYTVYIIRRSRKNMKADIKVALELDVPTVPSNNLTKDIVFIVVGSIGLFFGAQWFINGAKELAVFMGVTERVIGITVIALGTSLPELVTAVVASYKKETDLAIGNLLGSNIFNVLSILGITSIVTNIRVNPTIINVDMLWMLGITLLLFPIMIFRRKLGRPEGAILLLIYVYYTYNVLV